MELIYAAIAHLKLDIAWLPSGDPALKAPELSSTIKAAQFSRKMSENQAHEL
jgi:hypothetical protein